jgi:hypothetical protein
MHEFLWGALAMAGAVAGLFFLRFWTMTRDRFFLTFALAFWVLSAQWVGLAVLDVADESRHYLFMVRLAAFVLILLAIADKNRRP